jgi:hypothetical protein
MFDAIIVASATNRPTGFGVGFIASSVPTEAGGTGLVIMSAGAPVVSES